MMNKRGLTPIIAIVLLLLMTVLAGAATMLWIQRLQGTIASETERQITSTVQQLGVQFTVPTAYAENSNKNVTFAVSNTGTITLNLSEFMLEVREIDASGNEITKYVCSQDDLAKNLTSKTGCNKESVSPGSMCLFSIDVTTCSVNNKALSSGTHYILVLIAPQGQQARVGFVPP